MRLGNYTARNNSTVPAQTALGRTPAPALRWTQHTSLSCHGAQCQDLYPCCFWKLTIFALVLARMNLHAASKCLVQMVGTRPCVCTMVASINRKWISSISSGDMQIHKMRKSSRTMFIRYWGGQNTQKSPPCECVHAWTFLESRFPSFHDIFREGPNPYLIRITVIWTSLAETQICVCVHMCTWILYTF